MSSKHPVSFKEMAISRSVLQAVEEIGYEIPTAVQAACIPSLLKGGDLIGLAQTGTGKTAAFALPLLSRIDLKNKSPQVLVLTPTRELSIQVAEAFQKYASKMSGFHVLPIYGGQDYGTQLRQLKRGPHVIVGTPGRIMDHLRRKSLKLQGLSCLVLDEADEMLRMGFIEDVEWILEHTPAQHQTALFSATMPAAIKKVAGKYLKSAEEVKIASRAATGDNIEQHYWIVSGINKLDALTRILEVETIDAMLIFVRTKTATVDLAEKLEARGYPASALNGDMSQQLRERTIDRLRRSKLDILVATDVAARGIDVERISHVLNYDIPHDSEAYIHRIGRTGRAGRKGKAILFVAPREKRLLHAMEKASARTLTRMELPSGESITRKRIDQFKKTLSETIHGEDLSFFEALLAEYSHENDVAPEDIAAALAFLYQQKRPLKVNFTDTPVPAKTRKAEKIQHDSIRHGKEKMLRYRFELGKQQGVGKRELLDVILGETGLEPKYVDKITIHEDYTTAFLPAGMPREIFTALQQVKLYGKKLNISEDKDTSTSKKRHSTSVKKGKRPTGRDKPRKVARPKRKKTNRKHKKT